MNEFNKKWLTITAGVALSGALLMLITNQFATEKQDDVWLDKNTQQGTELTVTNPEQGESQEENGSNLSIPSISGGETGNSTSTTAPAITLTDGNGNVLESHPDSNVKIPEAGTMNGDDKGTSQTIQPDVATKPTYSQSQLTDPTQTPDGGKVTVTEDGEITPEIVPEPTPTPVPTPEPEPPTTSTDTSSTTSSGTTSQSVAPNPDATPESNTGSTDGMAYVPGFGWVPQTGPSEVIQATDMYENGNKVGNM